MTQKKNIFVINGSASENSANQKLIDYVVELTKDVFGFTVFNSLKSLPHFDPERSVNNTPQEILAFRNSIEKADAILICTPEYIFSIPSGLKNALEWCVATTVFSEKPTGLITASAHGQKAHAELQLIMSTIMATFTDDTCLLIQGVKGKFNEQGEVIDAKTKEEISKFSEAFELLV